MFKEKNTNYLERRKVAKEMKLDGYISMVQISGSDMHFEHKGHLFKVNATPKEVQRHVEESGTIHGYKLYFGGVTYKYWYKLDDLVKLPFVKLV